jgi:hypothetical protein
MLQEVIMNDLLLFFLSGCQQIISFQRVDNFFLLSYIGNDLEVFGVCITLS